MPKRKAGDYSNGAKRAKSAPRRRANFRRGRISRARPMRSLKTNYRANNVYRFVRETLPETKAFTIISAGTNYPAMGYMNFDNLQFNQLVESTTEFGALFARYKVDKIVTYLTPLFQETVATTDTSAYNNSGGLRITRINTKWLDDTFAPASDADDQLRELAQIQSKSVSNYASNRTLKITTINPGVASKGVLDSAGNELSTRAPMPWLNATSEGGVPMRHNSVVFAERTDGGALNTNWKYRVVHKCYFRCAQVG